MTQQQKTGVWIDWQGGEQPVPDGTIVVAKFAGSPDGNGVSNFAEKYMWRRTNMPYDIIAYMILPEEVGS